MATSHDYQAELDALKRQQEILQRKVLEAQQAEAEADAVTNDAVATTTGGAVTGILWRWQETVVPKTFLYLHQGGMSKDEATQAAIANGDWQVSRVYQVSLDGGITWHSAPAHMPVIAFDGSEITGNDRVTGKPSASARAEVERRRQQAAGGA